MNPWDMMIDPASFGLIAGYLQSTRSPINFLLHVKDRGMLSEMAQRIDQGLRPFGLGGLSVLPPMQALAQEGAVKISARHPLLNPPPGAMVDPQRVRRSAYCEVIYLPPYYLVHTPGLFEGKVTTAAVPESGRQRSLPRQTPEPQAPERKKKDQGHSH